MLKNLICGSVSVFLTLAPALSFAAGITVAPGDNAKLGSSANGTQVVNINNPNTKGVSLNKFTDFNVTKSGVILNNSTTGGNSQIGGAVDANSNLTKSASTIINQVTGNNRSLIEGATEIFGASANYILANSNGITCNGCGFINTPRVTLTTGTPNINVATGQLNSLDVTQGDVTIEGLGVDARNLDYFEIVSRVAHLNGMIYGNDVTVSTGAQNYSYAGQYADGKNGTGVKPTISLDSSALGGIQAGNITLVGSEAGVGVNLKGNFTASENLVITSDGKLVSEADIYTKNGYIAAQDINITRKTGEKWYENTNLRATGDLTITAVNNLINDGVIWSTGYATLNATNLSNNEWLLNEHGVMVINATNLTLNNNAAISNDDGGTIIITAVNLDNHGYFWNEDIGSNVQIKVSKLDNYGIIHGGGNNITINANNFRNYNTGDISIDDSAKMTINAVNFSNAGLIEVYDNSALVVLTSNVANLGNVQVFGDGYITIVR